jgi:hypothetical protein
MAKKKDKSAPVYQLPAEKTLNALLRQARKAYKDTREIAGEQGAAIANAVEHSHLHKKAFSTIKGCDRMTAEKLAEWKAHFDDYFVKCGLQERADSVERLPMGEDESDGKVADLDAHRQAAE